MRVVLFPAAEQEMDEKDQDGMTDLQAGGKLPNTIPIQKNLLTEWVFHAIMRLKKSGFLPDGISGHPRAGRPLFLKAFGEGTTLDGTGINRLL